MVDNFNIKSVGRNYLILNIFHFSPFNYLKNILDSFERESKFLIGDLIIEITNDFIFIKKGGIKYNILI